VKEAAGVRDKALVELAQLVDALALDRLGQSVEEGPAVVARLDCLHDPRPDRVVVGVVAADVVVLEPVVDDDLGRADVVGPRVAARPALRARMKKRTRRSRRRRTRGAKSGSVRARLDGVDDEKTRKGRTALSTKTPL